MAVRSRTPLSTFVRVSSLALLVLGLALNPVLDLAGQLHAFDHALAAQSDGHDHDHDHEQADDSGSGEDPAPDHSSGVHGLMHQASGGSALSVNTALAFLPEVPFELVALPVLLPPRVPLQQISVPFRPPIA